MLADSCDCCSTPRACVDGSKAYLIQPLTTSDDGGGGMVLWWGLFLKLLVADDTQLLV